MSERCRLNAQKAPSLALAICVTTALTSAASAQCLYEVTYIEPPECPWAIFAGGFGLNDHGHIVGRYNACFESVDEAFVWTPELGLVTLPRPQDSDTNIAYDINNDGDIVGVVRVDGLPVATLWRNLERIPLGTLPGDNVSEALSINDRGQVVGYSNNSVSGPLRAFLWEDGEMTELELPLAPPSIASGISDSGMITGWMGGSLVYGNDAFVWNGVRTRTLPKPTGAFTADPVAINRLGEVVGQVWYTGPGHFNIFQYDIVHRGALWRDGGVVVLPGLPGFVETDARDIGEAGQVIGVLSHGPGGARRGAMWLDGQLHLLSDLVVTPIELEITSARAINGRGQILAHGTPGRGPKLLTPIDPPVGDVNTDCTVDVLDLIELLEHWGPTTFDAADLDSNGVVNVFDLLILLGNWGATAMP